MNFTAARGSTSMTAATRSRGRQSILIATCISAAILATGVIVQYAFRTRSPKVPPSAAVSAPPSIDRVADPAVKKLLAQYRGAVLQFPQSDDAWGKLGMAFFAHDFPGEARVCFAVAENLNPHQARWPYFQGVIGVESDPNGAFQKLERAANLCDDTPDAPRLQLAELLLAHGHLDRAAEQFRAILRRRPSNARAHLGLGRLAFQTGDLLQSQTHLGFSVGDRHTQKASHLLFAQIDERLGNKAMAEKEYREAASVPDDAAWPDPYFAEVRKLQTGMKALLIRVNLLLEQGRLEPCIAECRKLVHDYPDSEMIWLTLGKALVQKRELPAGQEVLRKVLQIAPDSVEAHFELGFASYLQRDYRAAATWYRKATELKPDFTFAYHDLGHCLNLLGDRAGAIEAFRAALRCQPDLAEVHKTLGELLGKQGQNAAAFNHLRIAVQLKPTDQRARQLLGQALNRFMVSMVP
jgi:tetratricopeptide (TPR) repeat protein